MTEAPSEQPETITTAYYAFETPRVNPQGTIIQRQSRTATYFRENLGSGFYLDMVYVAGGKFLMGAAPQETKTDWSQGREEPQHIVTVPPFWIGKYAVTQEQWQIVMRNNPSWFKGAKRPVENVSWLMGQEFCAKLAAQTGKPYQLPSEAQWEYACRAGTTTPFCYGATLTPELANYDGSHQYAQEPQRLYRRETVEVGKFLPNAFGLYEMHGNVWEWCQDQWHDHYQNAPADGTAWEGDGETSGGRVIRGGSWHSHPIYCRSANRYHFTPDFVISYLGLRLVCPASEPLRPASPTPEMEGFNESV